MAKMPSILDVGDDQLVDALLWQKAELGQAELKVVMSFLSHLQALFLHHAPGLPLQPSTQN